MFYEFIDVLEIYWILQCLMNLSMFQEYIDYFVIKFVDYGLCLLFISLVITGNLFPNLRLHSAARY